MSYQALLFCPDERLARVVTQVFSELEFTVELVNEPFAAVKKLMAQRYDAIVVDCENDPNATLLFKSARNSSSNQSSLALALVEGQSGVAKAYRIGANLVLTKPINVEQAKGTLRVARGLLRKNLDAASASPVAQTKAAPAPAAIPFKPAIQNVEAAAPESTYGLPEFESAPPTIAASASVAASPALEAKAKIWAESDSSARSTPPASLFEATQPAGPVTFASSVMAPVSAGAASAPAPAREVTIPAEAKPASTLPVEHREASAPTFAAASLGSSPTFGALDDQDAESSGGSRKLFVIAAVVIVAAALGYFGWTKLSKNSSPSQSIDVPQTSGVAASAAGTSPAPSVPATEPAGSMTQPIASGGNKPSASIATPSIAISPDPDVVTKKTAPAIVVKSGAPAKVQPQAEESAPQVPNPLALAAPNEKKLSSLVSSVPATLPTATLSTVKISQGVSQGLLIKRVQPRYPQNAIAMRIQGAVQMEATINKEGNISNLKVTSGDPVLARAATDAVKQWRYKPYYLNGDPVEIETQITVNFKLPN